jgi:hypothetical protein
MNLREYGGKVWTGCVWLRTGSGCYEHCNELSGSIQGGEFLDYLSEYHLLKKDSVLWSWLVGWLATLFMVTLVTSLTRIQEVSHF